MFYVVYSNIATNMYDHQGLYDTLGSFFEEQDIAQFLFFIHKICFPLPGGQIYKYIESYEYVTIWKF